MNFLFPLVYSCILFGSLAILCLYLFGLFQVTQQVEQRITLLESRIQKDQEYSENFYKLGQLYLRKKIYDKAISLFRQALQHWDKNDKIGLGSLYNTLGFTYFKLKENEQAIYYYTQAIKLLPDYTLALTNLGLIYENKQLYKEAYTIYLKALGLDSQNKTAQTRIPIIKQKAELQL